MNPWLGSLVSVALVSLVSLVGVASLSFDEARLRRQAWAISGGSRSIAVHCCLLQ